MEKSDKGFYDYCNGYTQKEIADRQGVSMGAVKSWITRYHWRSKKDECISEDGTIDDVKVRSFISGKGNLKPVTAQRSMQDLVEDSPYKDEFKAYIKSTLHNSLRYMTISTASTDYEVQQRIVGYFNTCQEEGIIPTVEGLWLSLGIQKDTYYSWINGKLGTVRSEFLKRARLCIHEFNTQMAITGKMPQILYMFISKNHQEMKDETEQVVTHNNPLGAQESKQDIQSRIMAMPDDE